MWHVTLSLSLSLHVADTRGLSKEQAEEKAHNGEVRFINLSGKNQSFSHYSSQRESVVYWYSIQ
jgi:hypothetical protein